MSRVIYTRPSAGLARDAAITNAAFTAIRNASTTLDGNNLAQEGLDPTPFSANVGHLCLAGWRRGTSGLQVLANNAYATLTVGGYALRITGPIDLTAYANSILRVRGGFAAVGADDGGGWVWGIPNQHRVYAQLAYSVGGVPAAVLDSERVRGAGDAGVAAPGGLNGYFRLFAWLPPAVYDWIEIQTRCDAAVNYRVEAAWLYAMLFPRSN